MATRMEGIVSADPMIVFDGDGRALYANRAAELLLGIDDEDVLGHGCWTILAGRDEQGAPTCAPGCADLRLAREGWPVPCKRMIVTTSDGPKRIVVSTVVVRNGNGPLVCRILREEPGAAVPRGAAGVELTPRQREVLGLLAEGLGPRRIADRLGIAETTARNHIRCILSELHAHSQLEAVARAKSLGIV